VTIGAPPPHTTSQATTAAPDWAARRERSNMLALRVMAWIALHLGRRVARWLLHPITAYFVLFSPAARRQSIRYLRRALGREPGWADGYRHVHTFASTVLDRVWFVSGRLDAFDLRVEGGAVVDATLAEGRGAFLVGAHMGSFDALHAVGSSRQSMRVAMVMYPDNARMIHAALQAIEPDFQMRIIAIGRPGSTLAIRDWLYGGGLAGLLGDRFLDTDEARKSGAQRSFLGAPARFPDGPLRLAMLLKREVIFMAGVYRGGNRYDVRFETLADFRDMACVSDGEREQRLQQAITDYAARLEALCREAPYNWFNFHDFWLEDA
jgi:predicted LPLAT superfamily acyltransferase